MKKQNRNSLPQMTLLQFSASVKVFSRTNWIVEDRKQEICAVRGKLFLILSLLFFGLLPSANHKIYDFFIFSSPQKIILPDFCLDSVSAFHKINSFECHKQFKFLIFTQKYLMPDRFDVSGIYYRIVQLNVKSSWRALCGLCQCRSGRVYEEGFVQPHKSH